MNINIEKYINKIINADCMDILKELPDKCVDLVVTSPPYDNLRTYDNTLIWDFNVFTQIANEIIRVLRNGGVCVWVVADSVINGSETCSSFKQVLFFNENGLKLHDTMIWEKNKTSFPASKNSKRYTQMFEYMFILCKGKIRNDIKLLCDKKNKWSGFTNWGENTFYDKNGKLKKQSKIKPVPEYSLRNNVWLIPISTNSNKHKHPAIFPIKLAIDHILSWSNENDLVLDCFSGSGTTAVACHNLNRRFICIEKNKEYYEASVKRLEKVQQQGLLF